MNVSDFEHQVIATVLSISKMHLTRTYTRAHTENSRINILTAFIQEITAAGCTLKPVGSQLNI